MSIACWSRRQFLKYMTLGSAAVAMTGCGKSSRSFKPPNILFLLTDDQRCGTIHALGNENIFTPHMDRIARSGVTFDNTYIQNGQSAAVCMPSRGMLMSGLSTFHLTDAGRTIPQTIPTLPETLKAAGYQTFATGKWHNGKQSFARSFTHGGPILFGGMSDHWDIPIYHFNPEGEYPKEDQIIHQGQHSSELYADAAVDFLRNTSTESPFFAFVSFQAPHDPRQVPKDYLDLYDPETLPLPKNFMPEHPFDNGELLVRDEKLASFPRQRKEIQTHLRNYYGMISHLDAQIGRILDTLDEQGLADNTLIILAGDNGLALGQHGLMGKQNLYDHSVKVPLIVTGPGVAAGERASALCYLHDIYPTVCDLARVRVPDTVESKSLVPVLKNPSKSVRDAVVFAYKNFQRGGRFDNWKLIHYLVEGIKTIQLFDLKNDPWERYNLATEPDYRSKAEELTARLQTLLSDAGDAVNLSAPDWGVPVIPSW